MLLNVAHLIDVLKTLLLQVNHAVADRGNRTARALQGMLTAMKQEVTRKHKAEKWALDDVVYHTEVTSYERMEQVTGLSVCPPSSLRAKSCGGHPHTDSVQQRRYGKTPHSLCTHPLLCFVKTRCVFNGWRMLRAPLCAQVRSPPAEGVYIHGLFLDGAAWSKQEGIMVESEPKKLFVSLPVLFVSANTKSDQVRACVARLFRVHFL